MKIAVITALVLALHCPIMAQGDLNPPAGVPAPSMKTMQEIWEKLVEIEVDVGGVQTDIDAVETDLGGLQPKSRTPITAAGLVIDTPGSYYLANPLVYFGSAAPAIHITTSNVTIDLNGFAIAYFSTGEPSDSPAISIDSTVQNATILNGTIQGFATGVFGSSASGCLLRDIAFIDCRTGAILGDSASFLRCGVTRTSPTTESIVGFRALGDDSNFELCYVTGVTTSGKLTAILAAERATVTRCRVGGNSGTSITGIGCKNSANISGCTISDNSGTLHVEGISADDGSIIRHCIVRQNTTTGDACYGIYVENDALIESCTVSLNDGLVDSITAGTGIRVSTGCIVRNCSVMDNGSDGIRGLDSNSFVGNSIRGSGFGGDNSQNTHGSGIRVIGTRNLIEDNRISGGLSGVTSRSDLGGNIVISNFFSGLSFLDARDLNPFLDTTGPFVNTLVGSSRTLRSENFDHADHPRANIIY